MLAACSLHNYLRSKLPSYTNSLLDKETDDHRVIPGAWRSDRSLENVEPLHGNNATMSAKRQREELCEFVNDIGAVPWQDRMI